MNNKEIIATLKKCFIPACDYHIVNRCDLPLEERFMKHTAALEKSIESIEKIEKIESVIESWKNDRSISKEYAFNEIREIMSGK